MATNRESDGSTSIDGRPPGLTPVRALLLPALLGLAALAVGSGAPRGSDLLSHAEASELRAAVRSDDAETPCALPAWHPRVACDPGEEMLDEEDAPGADARAERWPQLPPGHPPIDRSWRLPPGHPPIAAAPDDDADGAPEGEADEPAVAPLPSAPPSGHFSSGNRPNWI